MAGCSDSFVLVVEDDRSIRELIVDILADAGYATRAVAWAEQAVEHLSGEGCRLIVTDLNAPYYTPEMRDSVWEAALADLRRGGSIPIIVVTAHSGAAAEDAQERRVETILLKPFQVDDLLNAVDRALRSAGPGCGLESPPDLPEPASPRP